MIVPIVAKRPPRLRDPWYLAPEGRTKLSGLTPETGLDEAIFRLARKTGRVAVQEGADVRFRDANRRIN